MIFSRCKSSGPGTSTKTRFRASAKARYYRDRAFRGMRRARPPRDAPHARARARGGVVVVVSSLLPFFPLGGWRGDFSFFPFLSSPSRASSRAAALTASVLRSIAATSSSIASSVISRRSWGCYPSTARDIVEILFCPFMYKKWTKAFLENDRATARQNCRGCVVARTCASSARTCASPSAAK